MNAIIKHPAQATGLPAVFTDRIEGCEVAAIRVPHVVIHAFHDTADFAAVWRRAAQDRRLVSATTALYGGGFPAALDLYAHQRSPDLIIVETTAGEDTLEYQLDALADLCHADTKLIVVGGRNDIQLYRRLVEMGVSNYLVSPVGIGGIISAIADIYRHQASEKIGRVTAVLGAKGGVGATTLAESLALEMVNRRASDVLLVDLDLAFGTCGIDLDIELSQGLTELLRDPDRVDAAMLDRVTVRRGHHLAVLGAAARLERDYEIDEDAVDRIIEIAQGHVRRIVLDIPHVWAPWVERALIGADEVLVVSTPELGSLRNAAAVIARLKTLRPNDAAPRLVLNQVGVPRRQEITARDIVQVLGIEPSIAIPFDAKAFSVAASRGKMATEIARRRPLAQAYARLAALVDPDEESQGRRRRRWLPGRRRRSAA